MECAHEADFQIDLVFQAEQQCRANMSAKRELNRAVARGMKSLKIPPDEACQEVEWFPTVGSMRAVSVGFGLNHTPANVESGL